MKILKQTYLIDAPIILVWHALVDPMMIEKWGGGPAKMDEKVGTKFSLWGGDIHGTNIKVVKEKKLVQDWFGGKWDKPSKVTFNLSSKGDETQIDLVQTDVPDEEFDDIDDGWKQYYLGPLKSLLEK